MTVPSCHNLTVSALLRRSPQRVYWPVTMTHTHTHKQYSRWEDGRMRRGQTPTRARSSARDGPETSVGWWWKTVAQNVGLWV